MDPATAIGVASGVIAFVDFSWKLITGAKGLYDKGETQSAENVRIGKIIKDLKEFSLDLDGGSLGTSKHEKALKALATNCGDLCQELIGILEKLKAKKNSRWETLKTTWASMRKADDISDIERRLGEYRAEMNTRLLALINEQQSGLKSQLDTIQSQAERLLSSSGADLKQLRSDFVNLLQKLEEENDDTSSVSSAESSAHPELFNSLNEISSNLSRLEGLMRTTPKEIRILEHLYFEGIFNRHDSIEIASANTFEWILKSDQEYRRYLKSSTRRALGSSSSDSSESSSESSSEDSGEDSTKNTDSGSNGAAMKYAMSRGQEQCMDQGRRLFQEWLSGGGGIFHISGKAGCGKSTLLKLIVGHKKTTEALERWAGKHELIVASFFFWRSDGDKFQMTLDGMRRSILFSTLRQCPYLIPMVLPQQWHYISANPSSKALESDLFRAPKIDEAFDRLMALSMESSGMDLSWCLFINGLDEYDALEYDQRLFAQKLRDWAKSSSVKICVTSRPEVQFLDTFSSRSRIHLHELTGGDIYQSVCQSFEKDEVFPRVSQFYLDLVDRIVKLSEGVFLWARLVVKILITEAGLHGDYASLRAKLRCTPTQLDDLYESLFSSLSRDDKRKVCYLFLLIATNPFKNTPNATIFDYIGPQGNLKISRHLIEYNYYNVAEVQERLSRQIQSLTRGLLVLVPAKSDTLFFELGINRIRFFHKTVKDYILTPSRMAEFEVMFPAYDKEATHAILLMTEISRTPICYYNSHLLASQFLEALSTETPLNLDTMRMLELVWKERLGCLWVLAGVQDGRIELEVLDGISAFENSFSAIAVFYGQSQYLRYYLDQAGATVKPHRQGEDLPVFSSRDSYIMSGTYRQGSPLLLSAILSLSNTRSNRNHSVASIEMLVSKQHSMKELAVIFETGDVSARSIVSLWMIFVHQLAYSILRGTKGIELHLSALERIISVETQERPFIILQEGQPNLPDDTLSDTNWKASRPARVYVSTISNLVALVADFQHEFSRLKLSDLSPLDYKPESMSVPVWLKDRMGLERTTEVQFLAEDCVAEGFWGCGSTRERMPHNPPGLRLQLFAVLTREEVVFSGNTPPSLALW